MKKKIQISFKQKVIESRDLKERQCGSKIMQNEDTLAQEIEVVNKNFQKIGNIPKKITVKRYQGNKKNN